MPEKFVTVITDNRIRAASAALMAGLLNFTTVLKNVMIFGSHARRIMTMHLTCTHALSGKC